MQALDKSLCRVQIFTDRETRIENIEKTSFVIGKSPEADVFITDEEIIRTDIGVNVLDGNIFITVLESPMGSWLGDKQLTPRLKTRYTGEPLTLGSNKVSITLSLTGSGTPVSPANLSLPPLPKYALEKLFPVTFTPPPVVDFAKFDLEAAEVVAKPEEQSPNEMDNALSEARDLIVQAKNDSEKILAEAKEEAKKTHLKAESAAKDILAKASALAREKAEKAQVSQNKASDLITQAKMDSEKILGEAKEEGDQIRLESESVGKDILAKASRLARAEADKALAEAHNRALDLKNRWELEQARQAKVAQDKANDLVAQAKIESEKIRADASALARTEGDNLLTEAHNSVVEFRTRWELECERQTKIAQDKANDLVAKAKIESEKILGDAKEAADKNRLSAELATKDVLAGASRSAREEADKILAQARNSALELNARWELEQERQTKIAQDKASAFISHGKKESEKILLEAKNKVKFEIENARREVISQTQAAAREHLQAARDESASLRLKAQKEIEEQRKNLLAESLKEAKKSADELVARIQSEANRTLGSAKVEKLASEQLRQDAEKFVQETKEAKTSAEVLIRQAELQRAKILEETELQRQKILANTETEASGAKVKGEMLKVEGAKLKAEVEKLKKEVANLKDEATGFFRAADADKAKITKEIERLKSELTILEQKKSSLTTKLEESNANFFVAEKESHEKITHLRKTVESTESLLKQKTTEINSYTRELQQKIEEKLKMEKDLKTFRDEKEKISEDIANLERQKEKETRKLTDLSKEKARLAQAVHQAASGKRQFRIKPIAFAFCLILGLTAIFILLRHQDHGRIVGFQQVPLTTITATAPVIATGSRTPAAVVVKGSPPPVAQAPVEVSQAPVSAPARSQAPQTAPVQAKPQVSAPVQTQVQVKQAPLPVSAPIPTSSPMLPMGKVTVPTTVTAKNSNLVVGTAKSEKPPKTKPKTVLPKTNPDERQRDLDALQFSE